MKALFCSVALLAVLAVSSLSAGEISQNNLSKMGLGGLQVMNDSEGAQVRGKGIAVVFGIGTAAISGSKSINGYVGLFHSSATGSNFSRVIVSGATATASGHSSVSGH